MASMWRRAMLYLGLGPDEDYDDYEPAPGPLTREPVRRAPLATSRDHGLSDGGHSSGVRPLGPNPSSNDNGYESVRVSHQAMSQAPTNGHTGTGRAVAERPPMSRPRPVVRAVSAAAKPHVVAPASFTDAQEVADEFKRNVPVIVNLQGVERDLMRRIIDFASGLCYGLGGQMERVANYVYLLTPSDVEVAPEERRRWGDRRSDG